MRAFPIALLLLGGCATTASTNNHPLDDTGGYSEMQLNAKSWQVSFDGNGYTDEGTTHAYALRRAAELTVASGLAMFYVEGEATNVDHAISTSPVVRSGNVSYGGTYSTNRPSTRFTIVMLSKRDAKLLSGRLVYDARTLLAQFPND